ncbi:MAG: hypothetical protein EPO40_17285 [Myxococcaceae bacterium]|nr:MAG: hypothetical protein EPO40_17285 [Myxococcaceae bacterium]
MGHRHPPRGRQRPRGRVPQARAERPRRHRRRPRHLPQPVLQHRAGLAAPRRLPRRRPQGRPDGLSRRPARRGPLPQPRARG